MSYHNYSQNLISHYTNFPRVKFTEPEALVEWPTGNSGNPEAHKTSVAIKTATTDRQGVVIS